MFSAENVCKDFEGFTMTSQKVSWESAIRQDLPIKGFRHHGIQAPAGTVLQAHIEVLIDRSAGQHGREIG